MMRCNKNKKYGKGNIKIGEKKIFITKLKSRVTVKAIMEISFQIYLGGGREMYNFWEQCLGCQKVIQTYCLGMDKRSMEIDQHVPEVKIIYDEEITVVEIMDSNCAV